MKHNFSVICGLTLWYTCPEFVECSLQPVSYTHLSQITNEAVDFYYEKAMQSGALGGKLLGAGGGGFLLFYCPKERQNRLRASLSDLYELPFDLEYSGTRVIYVGEKDWD